MEIMLNGQLVSCPPKEYKELMDMGFLLFLFLTLKDKKLMHWLNEKEK